MHATGGAAKAVCMSYIGDRAGSLRLEDAVDLIVTEKRLEATSKEQPRTEKEKGAKPLTAFKYADKTDIILMTVSWLAAAGLGICPVSRQHDPLTIHVSSAYKYGRHGRRGHRRWNG